MYNIFVFFFVSAKKLETRKCDVWAFISTSVLRRWCAEQTRAHVPACRELTETVAGVVIPYLGLGLITVDHVVARPPCGSSPPAASTGLMD